MTYGHLRADCLYTGISSRHNAWYREYGKAFTFLKIYTAINFTDEFRNVSVTLRVGADGWLGVVAVVDTRLIYKSKSGFKTLNK